MEIFLPILGVIAVIAVIAVIYVISVYNKLIRSKHQVEDAFSAMDIVLVKRSDLIPDLVATVKAAAAHEKDTLESVISARTKAVGAGNANARFEAEGELSQALGRLLAVTEAYPDLKANANFMQMQNDLKSMETEIENSRRYYNGTVKYHNNAVSVFPGNLIASRFGFTKETMYTLTDESKREKPKVEF